MTHCSHNKNLKNFFHLYLELGCAELPAPSSKPCPSFGVGATALFLSSNRSDSSPQSSSLTHLS